MNNRVIGIMGAMHEEINGILQLMENVKEVAHGMRSYYTGTINGIKAVVVFSRWGKVAAAITVSSLIIEFKITDLIFIGVAGAIHPELKIGDIVIGDKLIQHDMDARPLMPRHEIPLLGVTWFESDAQHVALADKAAELLKDSGIDHIIDQQHISRFSLRSPAIFKGAIASGDKFFSEQHDKDALLGALPEVLCVEMEGAAVAQACYEYGIPFVVSRIISDESNEHSVIDFPDFILNISSKYGAEIIRNIFSLI
ncbi:adenosylhomocysteine nucleosidase [Pedobacter westerhofensis]|uniref:adenosylhomocysteine nucleosidase n=1 Tax=Pedobacter westerhofensis TaxID=425512 RepID=A0A521CM43_9SPHI|nr:5'-methylthioadenosine/adenosylhomocysteine nucleosidase [Pedobacter westerhofensis]SMO60506.1 adenosylhomocysteine nucleosidase [Pedobacter westerhofensis]